MTLYDICKSIAEIEEGLACGDIPFECDKLVSAMKSEHPADVLDDILSIIGWDVFKGKEPSTKKVKSVIPKLEAFQRDFGVDLSTPIEELKLYIKSKE